jgi:hypothetical protein
MRCFCCLAGFLGLLWTKRAQSHCDWQRRLQSSRWMTGGPASPDAFCSYPRDDNRPAARDELTSEYLRLEWLVYRRILHTGSGKESKERKKRSRCTSSHTSESAGTNRSVFNLQAGREWPSAPDPHFGGNRRKVRRIHQCAYQYGAKVRRHWRPDRSGK